MHRVRWRIKRNGKHWGKWSAWFEVADPEALPHAINLRNGEVLQIERELTLT